ncbi:anti-sigma B factor antagonist [Streptomyces sp. MnatMP-M77]|uniref:STAS domain-containing protein n=1 Tax=unclassified Streptomyces TaxID=2593676 RepID=UPI0008052CA4|nr:STAS domain-containing protein [Streptomyces sp. MnatMP-M77]SBU96671.1 anti-sigma B factor antagonist [Streptomyces sp. MnatMP-M77]
MSDQSLTLTTHHHPAGVWVLTVSGELDHHTSPRFREALNEITLSTDTGLVLELSGLTYCDSTGITVLVTAYQRAQASGTELNVAGASPHLLRLFGVVGLDQVFTLQLTTEHAIAALRS